MMIHRCFRVLLVVAASVLPALPAPGGAITFDEFPLDTQISTQYAGQGILFSGDSPFITEDSANPTAPVLAGTPKFFGRITGRFVDPHNPKQPAVVESFRFDAGYFDSVGSVRIEWFDINGNKLGQRANTDLRIQNFEIEDGGGIASFSIGIFADEPAGYGIDNFTSQPIGPSILFREKKEDDGQGFWFLRGDEVPGFDHCGLHLDNVVYESHPYYAPAGGASIYYSADGSERRRVRGINGPQAEHSRATFINDVDRLDDRTGEAKPDEQTKVTSLEEVPIPRELATQMQSFIQGRIASGAKFRFLGGKDGSIPSLIIAMNPAKQKGGDDNQFTCVGLLEAAAESAGHNLGQGFVPNALEKFEAASPLPGVPGLVTLPLLSPELLLYCLRAGGAVRDASQWVQGMFDPVDFLVTDPVGRRLGFVRGMGGAINEIPGAFYSGNGVYEQFLIPNPLPGAYRTDLVGRGKRTMGGIATADGAQAMDMPLAADAPALLTLQAAAKPGSRGDVDRNGLVNAADLAALRLEDRQFTNNPNDPRDLTGDGIISRCDLIALERLLTPPAPGSAPFAGVITNLQGGFVGRVERHKQPVRGKARLSICFGATDWAATDALGNESFGTWAPLDASGLQVRLTFADDAAARAQVLQVARRALRSDEAQIDLRAAPVITMTRTPDGRYKAKLKVRFAASKPGGKPRAGTYVNKLKL